ncbi:NAD-dependent epimerase/dehydratase family protein [Thiobacillus sedimenti]|uniref:NAD-dependent epimerase/dehydratase family protein n=1 Tax=Thiobacillus sedimenti TaxID=3110231 RepID=A0ABZ1CHN0_9PROT|nr:NAD-dependent epimerase/dehydratase family protein [Thiobacillus sp. SCUT-2]WRS38585.1 NAD-dependent epimerase/dehydratase family protein [Thiobacillus sp. SCUT-2]
MHVLITGGAGFIGSHLADHHLARGDQVYVVDNLSTGSLANVAAFRGHPGFRFAEADILHWNGLGEAVAWADRIYHMAAVVGVKKVLEDPVAVMSTNMTGTERVLRAIHHGGWNPQVIIASTSEVYGFNPQSSFAESDYIVLPSAGRLRWAYAVTKLADEFLAFSYARKYGLHIVVARLFNTIGPNQVGHYGMVVPRFVRQAVDGDPLTVYGEGTQTRSFCDVRDTVVALDQLAGCPEAWGEVVNVGNDQEISIRALAELIVQRARSTSPLHFVSYKDAYGEEFEDVTHRRPVLNKLRALTGFSPEWTLTRTLEDLIERERAKIRRVA